MFFGRALVTCHNEAVSNMNDDNVRGPVGGRAIRSDHVQTIGTSMTASGPPLKEDEPNLVIQEGTPSAVWYGVIGNHREAAARNRGIKEIPAKKLEFSHIAIDGRPFSVMEWGSFLVRIVEITGPHAELYSFLD